MKILIVEDDSAIAEALVRHFSAWEIETRRVEDFKRVMEDFAAFQPQLVLLDIGLPFYNGYHWCGEIRKVSSVPVIFLSSASDNLNIVMAMNMGGDDFIAKPFDFQVLTAKVQALLRRTYDYAMPGRLLQHRGLVLNPDDGSFTYAGQKEALTRNECRILRVLLDSKGKIVSRERLMQRLWETDSFVDENTLNVNVARLRKKLAAAGLGDMISTKKGEGYLIE